MNRGWIVALVATLVIGLGLGVLGGALLFDDDGDSADTATTIESVDCDEAQAVVDGALERVTEINATEGRDAGYYATLIVEQRAIAFVMDVGAACFSLQDRAGNVGLLEGLHALLESLSSASTGASGATSATPPPDSSSIDE